MRGAANQKTPIWERFITSITIGNIAAISRPTATWILSSWELVASNRRAS